MTKTINWIAEAQKGPVVQIGQIPKDQQRQLDRLAKSGAILKWRGYWNTFSPRFGLGPLKSCYGPLCLREALEAAP